MPPIPSSNEHGRNWQSCVVSVLSSPFAPDRLLDFKAVTPQKMKQMGGSVRFKPYHRVTENYQA